METRRVSEGEVAENFALANASGYHNYDQPDLNADAKGLLSWACSRESLARRYAARRPREASMYRGRSTVGLFSLKLRTYLNALIANEPFWR